LIPAPAGSPGGQRGEELAPLPCLVLGASAGQVIFYEHYGLGAAPEGHGGADQQAVMLRRGFRSEIEGVPVGREGLLGP